MGKMIDAQSIVVANGRDEPAGQGGGHLKAVLWHSVALACVVGLITVLQAYVWPFTLMVPR